MSDVELLELPAPFRGLPYERKRLAFDSAQAMLPAPSVLAVLGAATAELVLVNAAAHWLMLDGNGSTETASTDAPASRHMGSPSNKGMWAGSPYGDVVASVLDRLPRPNGRGRSLFTPT